MSKIRCDWCLGDKLYENYHDKEWGVPVFDDRLLFESLTLETFQAGLSWITVLRKREHFKKAFDNFDYRKIASYNIQKKDELMSNPSIIRNRQKIESTIKNAKSFMKIQKSKGSFSNYIWEFVSGNPILNDYKKSNEIPTYTSLSKSISKDLKQNGFKFIGPTLVYSYMQAIGIVNDHLIDCFRYSKVQFKLKKVGHHLLL